ncbi:MAG: hypothetical protein M3Y18_01575 [Candidatus Eremiobacteraeota bacterium]|nr:hypothetical protein [Candidatus Eremiobacteraeota bacterium]
MKLACTSAAFDGAFATGDLTQIEWIELCARELAVDGIVLDVRHFPRTDYDYLAQIKKMTTDLGLSVAGVFDAAFFSAPESGVDRTLELALSVGAPIVAGGLASETELSRSAVLDALGQATGKGKLHNVTLAVRNAPNTFAASTHDLKRVSKEADSAWLRYGPDLDAFDASSEAKTLFARAVLLWINASSEAPRIREVLAMTPDYRGFVVLDGPSTVRDMQTGVRRWRTALESRRQGQIDRT